MTITTENLNRAAGLSAAAAGLLYVLIQFIHPHEDLSSVAAPGWTLVHVITMAMTVLALVGISAIYFRQAEEVGVLGLVGYGLFATFFLIAFAFSFVETFVLPPLADQAPQFVNDVLAVPTGGDIAGDVGALKAVFTFAGVPYVLGGLILGIALFRARSTARWAALALAIGAAATVLAAALPHSAARMMAIPVGVALVGLGVSHWVGNRDRGADGVGHVPAPTSYAPTGW